MTRDLPLQEGKKRKSSDVGLRAHQSEEAGAQPETSRPLVALVPAQKRHAAQAGNPSALPQGISIFRPIARHAQRPWLLEKDLRGQSSAPDGSTRQASAHELRESKSAPDLTAPVLAAIQALKNGSIQVDHQTRAKIAQAARRVLDARQAHRRAGQDRELPKAQDTASLQTVPDIVTQAVKGSLQASSVQMSPSHLLARGADNTAYEMHHDLAKGCSTLESPQQGFERQSPAQSHPFTVTSGVPKFPQERGIGAPQTPGPFPLSGARSRSMPVGTSPCECDRVLTADRKDDESET